MYRGIGVTMRISIYKSKSENGYEFESEKES